MIFALHIGAFCVSLITWLFTESDGRREDRTDGQTKDLVNRIIFPTHGALAQLGARAKRQTTPKFAPERMALQIKYCFQNMGL
jgi:hypothetical protein